MPEQTTDIKEIHRNFDTNEHDVEINKVKFAKCNPVAAVIFNLIWASALVTITYLITRVFIR